MAIIPLSLFKVNSENEEKSASLELLFDFAIMAMLSLIFNGFIINSHVAPTDQMFFMCFAAGLLATQWYAHTFFRQRYEKKGMFFRIWTFAKVITILLSAAGIDLMVFRLNGTIQSQEFLRYFAPLLFIGSFVFLRFFTFIEFLLAAIANRQNKALVALTTYKAISRLINTFVAIVHFILLLIEKNDVAFLTYVFMPIYLLAEMLGNFMGANQNNLENAPKISFSYSKERFARLNLLYISSLFVSGTIQFAFYFHYNSDLYMLGRLFATYFIGFLMWWLYSDRVYRMNLKITVKSLIIFSLITTFITMLFAIFGGMLINANNNVNLDLIKPFVLISLGLILLLYNVLLHYLSHAQITRRLKWQLILFALPLEILLIVFGVVCIFFSVHIWIFYSLIFIVLILLNAHSRFIIAKSQRKNVK